MEEEKQSHYTALRYGYIIRIHCQCDINPEKGLLIAKGFSDNNINYMSYNNFQEINNYRESLFQILPRGTFEIHDDFKRSQSTSFKENLTQRVKVEELQYNAIVQSRFEEEVHFGSEIILKHVDSGCYMQGSYECSDFSTYSFKLKLIQGLSSSIIFKLNPYNTFQKEGTPIYTDEQFIIQHSKSKCEIDFVKQCRIFTDEVVEYKINDDEVEFDLQAYEEFRPTIKKPSRDCQRHEAVISHNSNKAWVFRIHETYDTTKEKLIIKPYDLCFFQHTQNQSYLTVDNSTSKVIFKQLNDQISGYTPIEAVWELQPIIRDEYRQKTYDSHVNRRRETSIFQMTESKRLQPRGSMLARPSFLHIASQPTMISKINSRTQYIIRHYLSGNVLTLVHNKSSQDAIVNSYDFHSEDQKFELRLTNKGLRDLVHNSFVKVFSNQLELQIQHKSKVQIPSGALHRTSSSNNNITFYKRLNQEDLDYKIHNVVFMQEKSMHALKIIKVSGDLKKNLQLIISSHELIMQFGDTLKLPVLKAENKYLNDRILEDVQDVLRQLLAFVLGVKDHENIEISEFLPNKIHQHQMIDLSMVEIIMDTLFFLCYRSGLDKLFQNKKTERDRLKSIYQLSYILVEKMSKNNQSTKLHVSQWLELFLHQAIKMNDISVQTSLNELLDDNYLAISKFVTKTSIKRIVDLMSIRLPHEKYLKILSSICMCNGKSIINNQINVLNIFFKSIKIEFSFTFKLQENKVLVLCHIGPEKIQWRTLKQFFDESEIEDDLQSWNYFLSYINLLGDISAQRNDISKLYIDEHFPLNILCSLIEDPDTLNLNAVEPFLKLVHMVYIDCYHYAPIKLIVKVRKWNTIETKNDIVRTRTTDSHKPENNDLTRIIDFISIFLRNFQNFYFCQTHNNFTYTILQVLKTTLLLGFWKSIEDLKILIPDLLKICSLNQDLVEQIKYRQNQQDDPNTEQILENIKKQIIKIDQENMKTIKCKILTCEIIDIILDLENNVRLSKCTQIFKKMYQNPDMQQFVRKDDSPMKKSPLLQRFKRAQTNLSNLYEKHLKSKQDSFIYQFIDTQKQVQNNFEKMETPQNSSENLLQKSKTLDWVLKKNLSIPLEEQDSSQAESWIEIINQCLQSTVFSEYQRDKQSLELLFAELSLLKNTKMLSFSLSLLNRIYSQKRELIQNFENVIIVSSGFTLALSVQSVITRSKLMSLTDFNIFKITLHNQKDFNSYIWRESEDQKEWGIIQDLHYLCNCLKKQDDYSKQDRPQDFYNENVLQEIYNERQLNHSLHQNLIKSQDLHTCIINFISIAGTQRQYNNLIFMVLNKCYNFLTMMIWNNTENKVDLQPYTKNFLIHLKYNIGCIDFLRELYTNNKTLLCSEFYMRHILDLVFQQCNIEPISKYYKSKLFDFLRVVLVSNNKPMRLNQIMVLSYLQLKEYQNLIFNLSDESTDISPKRKSTNRDSFIQCSLWNEVGFSLWIEEYEQAYDECLLTKQPIAISSELTYMYTFFQIISLLIEDGNEINSGKCKRLHPYSSLLLILELSGRCWPLKRYVRAYINRLYYIQKDYNEVTQYLIEKDFELIINDLQSIIDIKLQTDNSGIKNIKLKEPVRYSYLFSYIYLLLDEILITINLFVNRQKFLDDLEEILYQNFAIQKFQVHFQLLQMGQMLSQVKLLWGYSKKIYQLSKTLANVFRGLFKTFDLSILIARDCLIRSLNFQGLIKHVSITKKSYLNDACIDSRIVTKEETLSDPIRTIEDTLQDQIKNYTSLSAQEFLRDEDNCNLIKEQMINRIFDTFQDRKDRQQCILKVSVDQMFKKKQDKMLKSDYQDENYILKSEHQKLINSLLTSEKFQNFLNEEFLLVCERLNKIDDENQALNSIGIQLISLREFVTNIITLNINDSQSFTPDLKTFFLKILTRIITDKNSNSQERLLPIDHWTPQSWSQSKHQIEEAQIFLEECGVAEFLCSLLENPGLEQRTTLTKEILLFGIALILGGNKNCQNSILQRLIYDEQNIILLNYTTMIKKIGIVVYNNFKIKKIKSKSNFYGSPLIIDNYNFYDENSDCFLRNSTQYQIDEKELAFLKDCNDIMCRSFRFLQLLNENNNIDIKHFMRQQHDKDGTIKLNTINLIEFTTSQLRLFLKIMNKFIINIPNFMLDFLIEVIQLPCLENQLTLCKTTFFEDSCYLTQLFSDQKNIQERLFDSHENFFNLQELYNKILIVVLSVLEGNDERIFEDLQNKLEPIFLIQIIVQNLDALEVNDQNDIRNLLKLQDKTYSEEILKILNVLIIKQKIFYQCPKNNKWIVNLQDKIKQVPNLPQIIEILESKIRQIEIVYQGIKQVIFFPSHPLYDFLSKQTKDKIMYGINRDTPREKILGLLERKTEIFNEIEHNYDLNQYIIPVTDKTLTMLHKISAVLSVLVNLMMVLFYDIDIKNREAHFEASPTNQIILNMVEFCQLFASILYFIYYMINRAPLCLKGNNDNIKFQEEESPDIMKWDIRLQLKSFFQWVKKIRIRKIKINKALFFNIFSINSFKSIKSIFKFYCIKIITQTIEIKIYIMRNLFNQFNNLIYLAKNEDQFLIILTYVLFATLGTFVKNYFFSLHIFYLFSRIDLLQNVFKAITHNAKQLIVVSLLGVLFIFVFSFTALNTYVNEIYKEEEPENHCNTLISCVITLTTSGVIGNNMEEWNPTRFMLDTVYYVFFALLFTNIVSGIMIDTFAELRDMRQKSEDDKKNFCFICGIDRVTLEKKQEEFQEHIHSKHYLWNYIYYIYGLIQKDSTEYSGLEYAISDMIQKEEITWFPIIESDNSLFNNIEYLIKRIDSLEIGLDERNIELQDTLKAMMTVNKSKPDKHKKK